NPAGFVTQIAGSLVRQGMPAFDDAGAADDPFRVTGEVLAQLLVGDQPVRDVTSATQHPHTHNGATAGLIIQRWHQSIGQLLAIMHHRWLVLNTGWAVVFANRRWNFPLFPCRRFPW